MSGTGDPTRPPPTRWWSRALVAVAAGAVAAAVAAHLSATFLYNAPANPVSQRYAKQVDGWMVPLFQQNWRLFAPDPMSQNVTVLARARLRPDGRVTGWVDLTGRDAAVLAGDPVPGRLDQAALRGAWLGWAGSHGDLGAPAGPTAALTQDYLIAVVVSRLGPVVPAPIASVQLRVVTALIAGPGRDAAQTAPRTRTLDWWPAP